MSFSVWDSRSAASQLFSVVVDFLGPLTDSQGQSLGVEGLSFSVWGPRSGSFQGPAKDYVQANRSTHVARKGRHDPKEVPKRLICRTGPIVVLLPAFGGLVRDLIGRRSLGD